MGNTKQKTPPLQEDKTVPGEGTALDLPAEGFALYVLSLRASNQIDRHRLTAWMQEYLSSRKTERDKDNAVRAIQAFSGRLVAVATELSDSIV